MTTVKIIRKISISPKYLDKNISKHLLERVRGIYQSKCTKQLGYFLEIPKITKILGNSISTASGSIIFKVEFEAKTLLPQINMEVDGTVCMVMETGLLAEVADRMNVMITRNNLLENKYKYDEDKNIFKKKKETIVRGDKIKIKLTNIKYEESKFICIGILF